MQPITSSLHETDDPTRVKAADRILSVDGLELNMQPKWTESGLLVESVRTEESTVVLTVWGRTRMFEMNVDPGTWVRFARPAVDHLAALRARLHATAVAEADTDGDVVLVNDATTTPVIESRYQACDDFRAHLVGLGHTADDCGWI